MQRKAVFLRVDGNGTDAQLIGRPHHSNGNFAAIGDEKTADPGQRGGHRVRVWGEECEKRPDYSEPALGVSREKKFYADAVFTASPRPPDASRYPSPPETHWGFEAPIEPIPVAAAELT
jgi:hypothetical protein